MTRFLPELLRPAVPAFWLAAGLSAMPAAAEETLLTVAGALGTGDRAFSLAELEAMPRTEFTTSTVWTEGRHQFAGVALTDLLDAVEAHGGRLRVSAVNDYAIDLPLDDPTSSHAVLAYEFDGAPMSRRGKGPLWLVYPYDSSPDLQTEAIYARSVWQVVKIEAMD